jgi:HSP20 family protein
MSEKRKHSHWEEIDEMFEEMHRRFDRMFEDVFKDFSRPLMDVEQCVLEPLADVRETTTDIIVTIDLPFVDKKEDISIELLERSLEITAKTRKPICFERLGTTQRKIHFNEFRKKVNLPTDVDSEGITATLKRRVLAINLPKKVQRTKIRVQ